jgi:hypothetical protein
VLHELFSTLVFLPLVGAAFVYARRFWHSNERSWSLYSTATAVVVTAGLILFGAGTNSPSFLGRTEGLIQRVMIDVGLGWLLALAVHLLRLPHAGGRRVWPKSPTSTAD